MLLGTPSEPIKPPRLDALVSILWRGVAGAYALHTLQHITRYTELLSDCSTTLLPLIGATFGTDRDNTTYP